MLTPEANIAAGSSIIPQRTADDGREVSPIRIEVHNGVAFVAVHGGLRDTVASTLRDILTWAVEQHRGVVVDLSAATTIDRRGLSVLLQAQDRAHARETGLCFAEPSKALSSALRALRADAMFVMFARCSDAFAWLHEETPQRVHEPDVPSARAPFSAAVLS